MDSIFESCSCSCANLDHPNNIQTTSEFAFQERDVLSAAIEVEANGLTGHTVEGLEMVKTSRVPVRGSCSELS